MKQIVWKYGLISGGILAVMMAVMVPLGMNETVDMSQSELIGYSSMVLAFTLVVFGVRSYRESVGGGAITFGQAFKVGILITLVTSVVYVATWQVVYYNFFPDFPQKYAAMTIRKMQDEGATAAELAKKKEQMAGFLRLYANPFINVAMTFMEVFPVGLLVSLVSALALRKKKAPGMSAPAAAAA